MRRLKTSHCNSRALFTRKAPTENMKIGEDKETIEHFNSEKKRTWVLIPPSGRGGE